MPNYLVERLSLLEGGCCIHLDSIETGYCSRTCNITTFFYRFLWYSLGLFQPSDSDCDEKALPPPPPPQDPSMGATAFPHTYVNGNVRSSWHERNHPRGPSPYDSYNAYNYTDSEQDSQTYAMSLSSGHLVANVPGSRAPLQGFSSFV